MAINNAIRLHLFGLLVVLSAIASSAQQTSSVMDRASQEVGMAPPLVAEMSPPKAPKVTCIGDQLTISADNSTLGGILAAVHICIGIEIDIPKDAAGKRTFEELGPGPVREVLAALLSGTDYNYVIGSSDTNPEKVETVLLMERTKDVMASANAGDNTLTSARRAWLASRQNRAASLFADADRPVADESSTTPAVEDATPAPAENANTSTAQASASDTPPTAPEAPVASPENSVLPVSTAVSAATATEAGSGASPGMSSGNGTSDKIAEMQQMFAQRRQMNQIQSQTSTTPQ